MQTAMPFSPVSQADFSRAWTEGLSALTQGVRETMEAVHSGQRDMVEQMESLAAMDPTKGDITPAAMEVAKSQVEILQALGTKLGEISQDSLAKSQAAYRMSEGQA